MPPCLRVHMYPREPAGGKGRGEARILAQFDPLHQRQNDGIAEALVSDLVRAQSPARKEGRQRVSERILGRLGCLRRRASEPYCLRKTFHPDLLDGRGHVDANA